MPATLAGTLVLAAAMMAFTAWDQSYWWRQRADYAFGWLVPVFVAYLVHTRWPQIRPPLTVPPAGASPRQPRLGRPAATLISAAAATSLVTGALVFVLGAFYRAVAGATHLSSLAIAAGMGAAVLGAVYWAAPVPAQAVSGAAAESRLRLTGLLVFPALIWLLSAPLLSVVDDNLAVYLMHQVTTAVFFVFDHLGLPLEQRGNVLVLPSGTVGVEEACSGIRSLTGCLFAGSFLAAMFLHSAWRKAALIASALVFALGANLLRSLFLTGWAYFKGAQSIEGTIHDLSGYSVLGLTVIALLLVSRRLDRAPAAPSGFSQSSHIRPHNATGQG